MLRPHQGITSTCYLYHSILSVPLSLCLSVSVFLYLCLSLSKTSVPFLVFLCLAFFPPLFKSLSLYQTLILCFIFSFFLSLSVHQIHVRLAVNSVSILPHQRINSACYLYQSIPSVPLSLCLSITLSLSLCLPLSRSVSSALIIFVSRFLSFSFSF